MRTYSSATVHSVSDGNSILEVASPCLQFLLSFSFTVFANLCLRDDRGITHPASGGRVRKKEKNPKGGNPQKQIQGAGSFKNLEGFGKAELTRPLRGL